MNLLNPRLDREGSPPHLYCQTTDHQNRKYRVNPSYPLKPRQSLPLAESQEPAWEATYSKGIRDFHGHRGQNSVFPRRQCNKMAVRVFPAGLRIRLPGVA